MGEDFLKVQAVGLRTLKAMKGVIDDRPPFMRVKEIGDYSIHPIYSLFKTGDNQASY